MPPVELPDHLFTQLSDIERRLKDLETGNPLGKAGLQEGRLVITDAAGKERIRLGTLSDTNPKTYGLRIVAGSINVDNDVITSTFGNFNAEVAAQDVTFSATYDDLPVSFGPTGTVTVSSTGNLLVVNGADIILLNTTNMDAAMSYNISGANTMAAQDARSCRLFLNLPASSNMIVSTAYTHLYTGLTPGNTTITAKYRSDGSNAAIFNTRFLFAIPL